LFKPLNNIIKTIAINEKAPTVINRFIKGTLTSLTYFSKSRKTKLPLKKIFPKEASGFLNKNTIRLPGMKVTTQTQNSMFINNSIALTFTPQ
jgi:ribosomal protein S2